jgi:hypothetical protein
MSANSASVSEMRKMAMVGGLRRMAKASPKSCSR